MYIIHTLGACLWIWIGCQSKATITYEIIGVAVLLGASGSTHQTCSMSMIANLVGPNIGDLILHIFQTSKFHRKEEFSLLIYNSFNIFLHRK